MSSSSRSRLHLLIGFLVSAAAIYLSIAKVDFNALWRSLQKTNYFLLLPALAGQFFCFVLKGIGWRYLLIPAKRGISVTSSTSISLIGLMLNDLFPARLGELARAYLMGERENIPKALCLSTVLVEHLLNILVLLVLLLILLPSAPLPTWLQISGALMGFTALGILVALFIVMRREEKFLGWANRLLIRFPDRLRGRMQSIVNNLIEGLRVITSRYILYAFTALFLMWSMVSLVAYVALAAFGLSLPIQAPVMVTIFTAFGKIIPSSPGALGTFHFLAMVVLMGFHVSKEVALGYAIVLHAVSFLMEVSLGIAALLVGNLGLGTITRRIEEPS